MKISSHKITTMGLLIALSIILTRVASLRIAIGGVEGIRIGLGGLPIILGGVIFGPLTGGIIGAFSYFPILGIPGTYLSFLAGNISNLRLPCSAIAQESAGVAKGSDEGSIISTIAISVSIIVNTVILLFGAIGLTALVNNLPPNILSSFDYILPAIFGAIFGQFLIRSYLLGAIALIMGIILNFTGIFPNWGNLLFLVFVTIIISRILWEKNIIK